MSNPSSDNLQPKPSFFPFDPAERSLVWQWTGVTAIGMFAFVGNSMFFALGIAVVAIGQWLLLRRRLKNAAWWLCVTPICLFFGFGFGFSIAGALQDHMDNVASSPLGIAPLEPGRSFSAWLLANVIGDVIGALILGIGQWLVLRRAHIASAWVPANLIGSAALLLPLFVPPLPGQLLGVTWFGAVTGIALIWCLRQRRHEAAQPPSRRRPWIWIVLAALTIVASSRLIPIFSHPYMRAIFYETIGNNVEAYKLFYIAGTPNGRKRVASEMTPAEIAEAERLAKEWLAAHPQK